MTSSDLPAEPPGDQRAGAGADPAADSRAGAQINSPPAGARIDAPPAGTRIDTPAVGVRIDTLPAGAQTSFPPSGAPVDTPAAPASPGTASPARGADASARADGCGGSAAPGANAMWGGRFAEGPAAVMRAINASIPFDKQLWRQDVAGSRAHAAMLGAQGIIAADDAALIDQGLAQVAADYARDGPDEDLGLEDIHMQTEARLRAAIGPAAGRLHTARSRNDQVATDFRLWVRDATDEALGLLAAYRRALLARAAEHAASVMPGFTHLQSAQPVTLGHHLMAYDAMAARDMGRLRDGRARANRSPLGAAALAGTGFPIDRHATAAALGFDGPTTNSLDSVSDRDFALEYLASAAQCALHLSRLAEEFVLWASQPFGFVALSDQWSTGSSIMPQKRNPDAAELVRGHAGRIVGCLTALAVTMKGLPLAYAKDMQDDKPPVFECHGLLTLSLAAMTGMVATATFRTDRMRQVAQSGHATATDLADWLVREAGLPFREAHHVTGRAVARADALGVGLDGLGLAELAAVDARIDAGALAVLGVDASVASRTSFGGTAPARVREAIAAAQAELDGAGPDGTGPDGAGG